MLSEKKNPKRILITSYIQSNISRACSFNLKEFCFLCQLRSTCGRTSVSCIFSLFGKAFKWSLQRMCRILRYCCVYLNQDLSHPLNVYIWQFSYLDMLNVWLKVGQKMLLNVQLNVQLASDLAAIGLMHGILNDTLSLTSRGQCTVCATLTQATS